MSRPKPTLDALRTAMSEAAALPLRERRRAARTLGFMASELSRSGALRDPADIDMAIDALALGAAVHTYPQAYQMARATLMMQRRQRLGAAEPVVAYETAVSIDIEVGGLVVVDADADLGALLSASPMHRALNDTGAFFVGFGGDGVIKVRLRVHESGPCEPLSSEFRKLREATPVAALRSVSGRMVAHGCGRKRIAFDLPEGDWAISAYGLGMSRSPQCLVIVAPAATRPQPLADTPELMI